MLELDHIAVAGETLEEAVALVEAALGVAMGPGGQHATFGTYNRLLGLENGLYLEAIAINPDAPTPDRPRWFDLDRFSGAPRLSNWICRTDDMAQSLARLPQAGAPVALARGDLRWTMAVPDSGILPYDNCFPALIEWGRGTLLPGHSLPPSGVRLRQLQLRHPQADRLADTLAPVSILSVWSTPILSLRSWSRSGNGQSATLRSPRLSATPITLPIVSTSGKKSNLRRRSCPPFSTRPAGVGRSPLIAATSSLHNIALWQRGLSPLRLIRPSTG